MSWPGWSAAPAPAGLPTAMAPPVQSSIMPTAINSAPSVIPPGLQYSPEQWAQAQQQNWQQWAQWQQQYQQWHQQYGAEYQKSMSAIQNTMPVAQPQPPLPAMPNTGVPPPLPAESKPPLPPEDPPANQPAVPSYSTMPSKPTQQTGYSTGPPQMPPQQHHQQQQHQQQQHQQQQQQQQPYDPYASQRQNWQPSQVNMNNKRPYGPGPGAEYDNAKRPLMESRNQWSNQRQSQWQSQQPQSQQNASYHALPPPQAVAKPGPNIEELSEAEKKFDKEFAAWEAQFNKWKDQNANHPDKTQYLEYEKKWESWRNSLLERREQMRRKRLAMVAAASGNKPNYGHAPVQQMGADMSRAPPLMGQQPLSQPQVHQPHRQSPMEPHAPKPPLTEDLTPKPPPHQNNEPLAFKPPSANNFPVEEPPENSGDGFLKSSTTSGGIPGLDLVKEDQEPKDADKENVVDVDQEEKANVTPQEPPLPKGPDLDAISKGINTILGDQKLLSMLSMVSQNPPSAPPPNVATDSISSMPPAGHNFNAPPPPPQQFADGNYNVPPPGNMAYNDHSNHSLDDRSNYGDNYQQRESVNNFDDQTRSSFTMGPMDQDPMYQGNAYPRNQGGKFPPQNRFGPEPGRGNFGPESGRGSFGPEPGRGNFGPEPGRGSFGAEAGRGSFGAEPGRGNFGPEPGRGNFGPESGRGNFGPEPGRGTLGPGANFAPNLPDNKSKFGPNVNRAGDFGPPSPGNFQQESGNLNQGPNARRPDLNRANAMNRNDSFNRDNTSRNDNYQNDKIDAQDTLNRYGSNFRGGFDRSSNSDRGNSNFDRGNNNFDRGNNSFDRGNGDFDRGNNNFDNDRRSNFNRSDSFNQKLKYDKYGGAINQSNYDDYENYEEEDDDYEKYHEMFNDDEDQDSSYQNASQRPRMTESAPASRMMNESGPPPRSMDQGQGKNMMNQAPQMRGMDHGPSMRGANQGPASARGMDQMPPVRNADQGPPMKGMDKRPPMRGMDQGTPMRGMDQGPPMRGMDQGPPVRGMDQGPMARGMDQGPPMGGVDLGPPMRDMDQGPHMRGMDQEPMMRGMDQGPPPPLMNEPPPMEIPEVPIETEDIFEPTTVVDYEHKSQRVPEPEVVIEPIHMFDYRHKPLNRIPVPQRPIWLSESVKFIREFDPLIPRPMNFERPPPDRYPLNKHRPEWEPEVHEDRYRPRDYNEERNGRFSDDFDRNDRRSFGRDESRFDRPESDERGRRSFSRENDRFDRKRGGEEHSRFESNRGGRGHNDFEELSDEDMNDFETGEVKKHRLDRSRSRSSSPILSNPPNPAQISEITMMEDVLNPPGRFNRPPRIVIILRGPPGSGKTYLAKIIKDKEVENGGSAPRILSLDDYFMIEQEKEIVEDGKVVKVKEMVYEFEAEMEDSYRTSFVKFFKKTITDGYFPFIIVDNVNDKVKYFGEMWSFAKQNGFQVYICQMDLDPVLCSKRNVHNRTEAEIEECIAGWEPTPAHHPTIDATSLLQASSIPEVEMEVVEQQPQQKEEEAAKPDVGPEDEVRSKWDTFDCSSNNLAKLDGVSKPLRPSRTMEEYLQLEDDWKESKPSKPGQKRVRWADLEEQREQKKMRAIGFVVGHTNWDRMLDPTDGGSALTQTKYFDRGERY